MSLFQVLQRPGDWVDGQMDSETEIIEDKFSWGATLLPPLWIIAHGLWLELFVWLTAMILLGVASLVIGGEAIFGLYVLSAFWLGYEASSIRVGALQRQRFRLSGDMIAVDAELAEMDWIKRKGAA